MKKKNYDKIIMKWPKVIRTYLYLYTIILKSKNSLNIFMLLLSHIIGHSTIFIYLFDPLFSFITLNILKHLTYY